MPTAPGEIYYKPAIMIQIDIAPPALVNSLNIMKFDSTIKLGLKQYF